MQGNGFLPVLFFFNPNIFPAGEYLRRKEECARYARALGLDFIDGDDDHGRWLAGVAGLENEPERGERCARCFRIRLDATARLAAETGIPLFTTTLTGSRWKRFDQIAEAGRRAAESIGGVRFWDKDWKKEGLTERRAILLRENGFYNQQYCGCEFSLKNRTP
jgi:predicted adenine nucleotide alpha hydrolase (AANH) superfamily ATPase